MTFLIWYLGAGHMTLALLIASNWFDSRVDVWLLVRIVLTVALWPVPLYVFVQEKWQKVKS